MSAQASVTYAAASAGIVISEGLFQDTVSGAEQMVGAFTTVPSTCGRFTATVGKASLPVTISAIPFPSVGEETAAVQVNITVPAYNNITVSCDMVAIRHGGTVVVVVNLDYPVLKKGLTQSVTQDAYAKAAALW